MRALHLLFILPILVVHGVTGQEARGPDYLYLEIESSIGYQPNVQRKTGSKQKVGDTSDAKKIGVTDSGSDGQIPPNYKVYKHGLKVFYTGAKDQINQALKTSLPEGHSTDLGQTDPTLQLRLQVAGRELTLEGTDSSAAADALQYGPTEAADSGDTGGKNYLLVYLYQGTSADTVPLLVKFGTRYFRPKDRATYFTAWQEVQITAGDGTDQTTALKNKLDEINRQLNEVDLTQTGTSGRTTEYGLEKGSLGLTGGFHTKRIEVTQSTNPVSVTSSQYTTISHTTTNGFNIGQIKVPSSSGTLIKTHTSTLSAQTHNQAVAVYTTTDTDSGALGTQNPKLVLICGSTSGRSTVHGYYKVTGDSDSVEYEFKQVTQEFQLNQLTDKESIKANTELVPILEKLRIVAQQESQVQEQHVEQQQETQNKDYLYLDIGNKGARYEAFVENKTVGKVKVGEDKQIAVAEGVGGTDAQVPDGYKGYNHGLSAFYNGAKQQINKALKPDSGDGGDIQAPELQLKLQVANRVITLFNEDGSIEADPLKYGQDQSSGATNDLVVYFYHKVGSSGPDTVPFLLKFQGKYYGPKDRATYLQKWQEVTIEGAGTGGENLKAGLKKKLDEINRQLNEVDLAQIGTGSLQQEYGLVKGDANDLGTFQTKRIDVRKSQLQASGSTSYPYVTHTTTNGYNIGNIGGLRGSYTFNNSHTTSLSAQTHNQAVAVYASTDTSVSETPKLVLVCNSSTGSGDDQTSTVHGYYDLSSGSIASGSANVTFTKLDLGFPLNKLATKDTVKSSSPELVTILESLGIVGSEGPPGPQGSRGGTGQHESQVQEQHVEQQQQESQVQEQHVEQHQTQLKDYLYLDIGKKGASYEAFVQRKPGQKQKVGDTTDKKITVSEASGDAQIPDGYKGYKHGLKVFYTGAKDQIKQGLKTSHANSQLDSDDRDPNLELILQVGGQDLALVDASGSPLTTPLQYGQTQASGSDNDLIVYFYGTGSTSGTQDTVPILFKFCGKYYGPLTRGSYFHKWQEITIAGGDGDLNTRIKTELDRINGMLNEIDLTLTGVPRVSEGYGLETSGISSTGDFNTKRIAVKRQVKQGLVTTSQYTIVTHRTANNYNIGTIKVLGQCQFDNKHNEKLPSTIHNAAIAVYASSGDTSSSLGTPQLVLVAEGKGSGDELADTTVVHGYYDLSTGCGTSNHQHEFKKITPEFQLGQLAIRATVTSSSPELVTILESLGIVATQSLPGGGGAGAGGVLGAVDSLQETVQDTHGLAAQVQVSESSSVLAGDPSQDSRVTNVVVPGNSDPNVVGGGGVPGAAGDSVGTGLAPGSPRNPGTSSFGTLQALAGLHPQSTTASSASASSSTVSTSAPSVSQPGVSSNIGPGGSSLGRTDDNRLGTGVGPSSGISGSSGSSLGQPRVEASVLRSETSINRQSSTAATTSGGTSRPDVVSVVATQSSSGQSVSGGTSLGRSQTLPLQTQSQLSDTRQQIGPAVGVGGRTGPGAGHPPVLPARQLPNSVGGVNPVVGQGTGQQVHTVVTSLGPQANTTTPAGPISTPVTIPVVTTIQPPRVTTGIRDVTTTTNSLRGPIFSVTDRTANISRVRETTDNENLIATNIKRALTMSNFYGFENLPVAQENDAQSLKEYLFRAVRHLVRILENVKYNIAGDEEVIVRELDRNQVAYHQADLNLLNGIKFENKAEYEGLYTGFKNLYNAVVVRLNMMILQSDPMQVLKHVGSLSLIPHSVAVQLERQYGRHVLAPVRPNDRAGRVASYPLLGFRIGIVATEEIMDRIQDVLARYLRLTGSRQPSDIVTLARKQLEGLQPISNLGQREFDPRVPDTPDAEVRELSGYLHSIANARNAGAEQPADSTTMDEVQSLMVQSVFTELTRQLAGDKVANYLEMLGESILDEPESQASSNQLTRVLTATPAQPEQPGSSEKPGLLGSIIEKTRRVASKVREKAQGLLKSGFGTESVAVPLAIALLMYTL